MEAPDFKPSYVEGVTVTVPGGPPSSVNPKQVLSQESAEELQRILNDAGYPSNIVQGHPIDWKGGAAASQTAPYLKFTYVDDNGQPYLYLNAGLLATNWYHPDGSQHNVPNIALRNCLIEIDNAKVELRP